MKEIILDMDGMTLEELVIIAREGVCIRLSEASENGSLDTRRLVEKWIQEEKPFTELQRVRCIERCDHFKKRHPAASEKYFDEPCGRGGKFV